MASTTVKDGQVYIVPDGQTADQAVAAVYTADALRAKQEELLRQIQSTIAGQTQGRGVTDRRSILRMGMGEGVGAYKNLLLTDLK